MAASLPVLSASALKIDAPTDFETVQINVGIVQGDAAEAMCGGWDFGQSVDGKISKVTGAPGRKGLLVDTTNKLMSEVTGSGLAKRDETSGALENGFVFPPSGKATGLSTVCRVNECDFSFPYKQACIPAGGNDGEYKCDNPAGCQEICTQLNFWVKRHMICTASWLEGDPAVVVSVTTEDTSPCFNNQNNDWCHSGDESWVPVDLRLQASYPYAGVSCAVDEQLYCCSDAPVADTANANCITCNGDGLEDRNNPGFDFNAEVPADLKDTGCRKGKTITNGREYLSYYRRYLVSYERDAVPVVERDDTKRTDIPVDCYCPYEEFDPKARRTIANDYRCVIRLEDSDKKFNNMKETQKGKGEYGQKSNLKDPAYEHTETRDTRKDLWVNDFSDAFSLLNGKKLQESPKDNLFPLLQLDATDIIPTAQLDQARPFSSGSLIRSTDDSVNTDNPSRRVITEWWQEQETQAHKLFTPSVLRLILPTPASVGLNLSDPFLTPQGSSSSNGKRINQQIIDIQIHASPEDLLSEVSGYLQNGLLIHVQEEPVPLVVPLASPVELRAIAQAWKRWGEWQGEGEAKTKAQMASKKLEDYAERIDQVRALRGEMARYIGRLLTYQGTMMRAIGEWLNGNLQAWESYAAVRQESLSLKPKWEEIQQKYRVFTDQTNMPWCRNERYTTPVYSFLDNWMPGPSSARDLKLNIDDPAANDLNEEKLPRLSVETFPDLVYDFTALRVSTGTVILPVLNPIQIRLKQSLLVSPAFNADPAEVSALLEEFSKLPDLPPVPSIYQEVLDKFLPTQVIRLSSPSTVSPTTASLSPDIEKIMDRISTIFTEMDKTYKTFWDSITEYPERDIAEKKWNCQNVNEMPCVHVEMDLLERFTRIGARPAVQLKEDFASTGPLRTTVLNNSSVAGSLPSMKLVPPTAVPPCPREDWSCQILNVEKTFAREGWRVEGVEQNTGKQDLIELRNRLRKETIPGNSSSSFPYTVRPDEMLPSFNIPSPITLPVTRSQSSSSS